MIISMNSKGKYEFWYGVASILIGVLCCLTFWLTYFGLFFMAVGTVLILLSKQTWHLQILTIVPPLGFVVYLLLSFLPVAENYYIQEGFNGVVYVIYDEQYGEEPEYDGLMKVYNIPESGVLFTKCEQTDGIHNRHFYYVSKNNRREELGVLDYRDYNEKYKINPYPTEPSRDSLAVFTPEVVFDSHKNHKGYYTTFTIGKYKNIKGWNWLPPELIDSLRKIHSLKLLNTHQ